MIKTVNVYEFHINVKIDSEVFENNKLFFIEVNILNASICRVQFNQKFPNRINIKNFQTRVRCCFFIPRIKLPIKIRLSKLNKSPESKSWIKQIIQKAKEEVKENFKSLGCAPASDSLSVLNRKFYKKTNNNKKIVFT